MMRMFWAHGYDGTQIAEIVAAIGIAPPSFYAAFGSKEAAFREAVDLYVATVGATPIEAMNAASGIVAAFRALLLGSVEVALSSCPGGCLLVTGAAMGPPGHDGARDHLRTVRLQTFSLLSGRLARAVEDGDLPEGTAISNLARFYLGVMQAISLQAREGASRAELVGLIKPALAPLRQRA